jgi:hypothetical protein
MMELVDSITFISQAATTNECNDFSEILRLLGIQQVDSSYMRNLGVLNFCKEPEGGVRNYG